MKPLCIDLFCGLGGWTEGFLAEGYTVIGFDNHRHEYGWRKCEDCDGTGNFYRHDEDGDFLPCDCMETYGGERAGTVPNRYPGQLVIQDVLTIHGSQFKDAAVIVASPPCQNYSYLAMPWSRSVDIVRPCGDGWEILNSAAAKEMRAEWETEGPDNRLFDACFRIQREAIEASKCPACWHGFSLGTARCQYCLGNPGKRYIPLIVENVRGAIPWVGRSAWNYGSFHLWGDVPALMPVNMKRGSKVPGLRFDGSGGSFQCASVTHTKSDRESGGWFNDYKGEHCVGVSRTGSKSPARKAASAQIAKIPFPLSSHIAQVYYPKESV